MLDYYINIVLIVNLSLTNGDKVCNGHIQYPVFAPLRPYQIILMTIWPAGSVELIEKIRRVVLEMSSHVNDLDIQCQHSVAKIIHVTMSIIASSVLIRRCSS